MWSHVRTLAAIPSPPSGNLTLGPLRLTAYGLMVALSVVVATEIARRRARTRRIHPNAITAIATCAVPAGLVGARLYHVATDWRRYEDRWIDAFKVWEGGLGIPGGLAAGVIAGLWVARRRGIVLVDALDVVAPALPIGQAIGRWGNWWNQELFGRPTALPWALEINPVHRPPGFETAATYHPAFLYESTWNVALAAVLVLLDRRRLPPGALFAVYVSGYGSGRLWIEALRIDAASRVGPWRINIWISLLLIVGALVVLLTQAVGSTRRARTSAAAAKATRRHPAALPMRSDDQ